jgi:hypothetical protein
MLLRNIDYTFLWLYNTRRIERLSNSKVDAQQHNLRYDKIIKNTLAQSDELTIRFINGLLNDNIPPDASVVWLDKESIDNKQSAIIADFYPRINGRMYAIEVEQDGRSGDMAVRIFKYTVGGAMFHNMTATRADLNITFPQPCVVFLSSTKNTPRSLNWNIDFFDGQKISLQVPTLHLLDLSIKEISERNLLPIGQFYLRAYKKATKENLSIIADTAVNLLTEIKKAVDSENIPSYIGLQMQDTVRMTLENILNKSQGEVNFNLTTNITEKLPWIDYKEIFLQIEERSKAEGMAEGKAERDMEIALKAFEKHGNSKKLNDIVNTLRDFDISDETIEAAKKKVAADRKQPKTAKQNN